MKTRKNSYFYAMSTAAALLLTAGCGSDDSDVPGDDAREQNLVEVASANADFSILVAAVQKAGLVETLAGAGPFTVFAPTDQAFAASGITSLDGLTADALRTILLYHVIGAEVPSSAVTAGPVDSAAGLTFFVGTDGDVTINGGNAITGGANVTATDIEASNGVIHVLDRVMLPPDIPTCATYGGLSGLVGAVGAAADLPGGTSVLSALQGDGPFTVFAPTNAAFDALTSTPAPEALRDVLLYHVVNDSVASSAIPAAAGSLLTNAWDYPVTLLFDTTSGAKVNGAAVQIADIKCTNGIVHVIDQVLLPPNVVQMAQIAGFSALVDAVGAAANIGDTAVAEALQADQPYTVFAPTNAAFGAISAPSDPDVLRDVLLLHVVLAADPVSSSGLPGAPVDTLLSGEQLSFDAGGPSVSSDGTNAAAIGPADIHVTNGVIHVIDKVLLP